MDAPNWLDSGEMSAWLAFLRAHTAVLAKLDRELREEHGLSLADYEVLAFVSEAPDGRMRMTELAELVLVSPSALTRRVDRLEREGLVERCECPTDARVTHAALTPKGRRRLVAAAPTHVRGVRDHLIDRLDRRELRTLATALTRVAGPPRDGSDSVRPAGRQETEPTR